MKKTSPLKLKPWQASSVPIILEALRTKGAALDMSDLGTGKTFTALEVAEQFLPADKAFVVVAPKATLPAWREASSHFNIPRLFVINYEQLRTGNTDLGRWSVGTKEKYFLWKKLVGLIAFDEAHRLRSPNGINLTARLSVGAKLAMVPQLFMSATLAESLVHMRTVGFGLGLHNGKDFVRWALARGCTFDFRGKLQDNGPQARVRAIALNNTLIPAYGVRVRRDSIPDFPDSQIFAELIELPDVSEINDAYKTLMASLKELAEMTKTDARIRDTRARAMVEKLRARQRTELVKANEVAKMILDATEEGMSVVLFANFRLTLTSLMDNLTGAGKSPSMIFGGQSEKERQMNVDAFQNNSTDICLVQIQSGGAGLNLHDIHNTHPRLAIHFPTYSATDMRQATGRVHRVGGTKSVQKIIFAAGTVEVDVMKKVQSKLNQLDLINDADLQEYEGLTSEDTEGTV